MVNFYEYVRSSARGIYSNGRNWLFSKHWRKNVCRSECWRQWYTVQTESYMHVFH